MAEAIYTKGKAYKALEIPAEKNWKTTAEKVYYTGVLTGISGAGFNTRYAVRSYMKVDGQVFYGNTLVQSAYVTAQEMLKSSEVSNRPEEMARQKRAGCV